MAFPQNTPVTSTDARSLLQNALSGRGIDLPSGLSQQDEIAWALGCVLSSGATFPTPTFTGTATAAAVAATGAITSSGGGIGYATGAGGAVTQLTDRSTGVTLSKPSGAITTDSTSLAAGASATFTVTNTTVAIGDVVIISKRSGGTANTSIPFVSAVAAGSFDITLYNRSADTADTAATIINFAVIKAVGA